uniref:Lipoprotein n=1 Tax=Romanomermis culicivorax TaxID=13658 RepID=A0A915K743_ROMCU
MQSKERNRTKGTLSFSSVPLVVTVGCSSFVGFQGKKQQMTLAKPGSRPGDHCVFEGHILHEMMHACIL